MPSCPLNKHGSTPTKTSHFDCQGGTVTRSSQSLKPNVVRWLEHCWAGQLIPPKRKGVDEFWMSNSSSCCCNCRLSMTMLELYGIVVNAWVQSWMIRKDAMFLLTIWWESSREFRSPKKMQVMRRTSTKSLRWQRASIKMYCTNRRIHSMPKSMTAKCPASLSLSRSNSSLKSSGSSPSRFSSSRATWRLDQALRYEALCHALGLHDFDAQPSCRRHWLHIATSTPCTSGDLTSHEHLQRLFCNKESHLFTANHKR